MGKNEVISLRVSEIMNEQVKILALLTGLNSQELYRMAISEHILKNQSSIEYYKTNVLGKTIKFKHIDLNEWIRNDTANGISYIKINECNRFTLSVKMLESFTDNTLRLTEYKGKNDLSLILKSINGLNLDIKMDGNGLLYEKYNDDLDYFNERDSELALVQLLSDYCGKEIYVKSYKSSSELKMNLEEIIM